MSATVRRRGSPLAESTASSLSTSAPLPEQLAADSVSGVLAFLLSDAIVNDPDARLRAFVEIAAHIGSHAAYECSLSKTTSFDSGVTPLMSDGGSSPACSRWKWADVVMRGVTDPWSRIRALSIAPMASLLHGEVCQVLQRQAATASKSSPATPSEHTRSPHSDPTSARGLGNGQKKRRGKKLSLSSDVPMHVDPTPSFANPAPSTPPSRDTLTEGVSAPLGYVWQRWKAATHWYEHDGIVRLLIKVYARSGTRTGDALRTDEAGIRILLFTVLFPALCNAQLPVRESASTLLGVLVDRERSTYTSPAVTSFVVEHVLQTLAQVPACHHSPLTAADEENTRVLEGHLLALGVLVDMNVASLAESGTMPLLLRLSSYPASSVRQYIAQILRPPSSPVFVYLMQRLCEHEGQKPHRSEDDPAADEDSGEEVEGSRELNWQRQETVMMALQQHFVYITSVPATLRDFFHVDRGADKVLSPSGLSAPLAVVFQATLSPRFEVARMGMQLFPLLLQFCVRFSPAAVLPSIFEACCGADGCVQQELRRLATAGDAEALSRAQTQVATMVLPALWFFVTVRRIAAEVRGARERSPNSGAPSESRALVEEVVRPYLTLERVRYGSQAHCDTASVSASVASAGAAAPMCALLVLTAYFAHTMDRAEWHRCVEEVLKPRWWEELLSNPVRRELVRLGPDFVRAVHRCGTAEQSQRIVELIPTLTAALADAQTHQQCLLIAMIRVAITTRVSSAVPADEKAMAYVYHEAYAAPALTEGGEAAPLGHTWLKLFVPTHDAIPTAVLWGPPGEPGGEARIVIRRDSDVYGAIAKTCLKDLFQSTKTEPPVLREIRALMMNLSRLPVQGQNRSCNSSFGSGICDGDVGDVDWYAEALEAVFGRLEKVCPRWREVVDGGASNDAEAEEAAGDGDVCWDDWDDDEEDADGAAQGIYEAEAITTASTMLTTLREWIGVRSRDGDRTEPADERFAADLAALKVK